MTLDIRAGFIPLLDAAPLIVASAKGFAEAEGVSLTLVRETSWATLRDRLAVRHLDAAHSLAPMVIAANLGLGPLPCRLVAPIALGSAGNTITVTPSLWLALARHGAPANFAAGATATALAREVAERKAAGGPSLTFAIVHPFSVHHYTLAAWLTAAGLDPDRDIELVVVPPPLMPDALEAGHIDGFCVGEPWGSAAAARGGGRIVTTSAHIWRASPDKVLAVRAAWAEEHPDGLDRLVRAVFRAAVWCDAPENRAELAAVLAKPEMLGQAADILLHGLERRLASPDGSLTPVTDFLAFADSGASFPWSAQALWLYAQMVRCRQVEVSAEGAHIAQSTFRGDLYERALGPLGSPPPALPDISGDDRFDPRRFTMAELAG